MDAVISYCDLNNHFITMLNNVKKTSVVEHNNAVCEGRFRNWGTLKYVMRGISENMPFIDKIILIVSDYHQVPKWINTDFVKVVYHKEFIPSKYLPTFNSRTIELFIPFIEGLSEKFIYFNDDMIPYNTTTVDSFFYNGKIREKIYSKKASEVNSLNIYKDANLRSMRLAAENSGKNLNEKDDLYFEINHGPHPLLKSACVEAFNKLQNVSKYITTFRTSSNVIYYYYIYYMLFNNLIDDPTNDYHNCNYIMWCNEPVVQYFNVSRNMPNHFSVCFNDDCKNDKYEYYRKIVNSILLKKYPDICKYEKDIRTAVCVIVKNENLYLEEFIQHYKSIGFDDILLYDNNDHDGESPKQFAYKYNYVKYHNKRGLEKIQNIVYEECYHQYSNDYDWIAFFDCDEFLEFTKCKTIKSYLSNDCFKNYQCIHVNWMLFGDKETLYYEDRPVQERFPNPYPFDISCVVAGRSDNDYIKSIVRTGMKNLKWSGVFGNLVHTPSNVTAVCDNKGDWCLNLGFHPYDYTYAYLKHYRLKSVEEYCKKIARGYPDQIVTDKSRQRYINRLFDFFDKTPEVLEVVKK